MSRSSGLRRTDLAMSGDDLLQALEQGYCGRLATVGADGFPYCVPLLYVWADGQVFLHTARARGHLRANLEHERRVCFVVDEPGEVFPYGRFDCDTTLAYRSVTLFGSIADVEDLAAKRQFFTRLIAKYAQPDWDRPRDVLPRIEQISLYAITPERMTGKQIALPALAQRWPAVDRTKSPDADAYDPATS
jgi:nitroimidazol reductase NimA-like FMN-containing flavoprotein (pyridoxamine 5'-phosphate oxidase superfamily)